MSGSLLTLVPALPGVAAHVGLGGAVAALFASRDLLAGVEALEDELGGDGDVLGVAAAGEFAGGPEETRNLLEDAHKLRGRDGVGDLEVVVGLEVVGDLGGFGVDGALEQLYNSQIQK